MSTCWICGYYWGINNTKTKEKIKVCEQCEKTSISTFCKPAPSNIIQIINLHKYYFIMLSKNNEIFIYHILYNQWQEPKIFKNEKNKPFNILSITVDYNSKELYMVKAPKWSTENPSLTILRFKYKATFSKCKFKNICKLTMNSDHLMSSPFSHISSIFVKGKYHIIRHTRTWGSKGSIHSIYDPKTNEFSQNYEFSQYFKGTHLTFFRRKNVLILMRKNTTFKVFEKVASYSFMTNKWTEHVKRYKMQNMLTFNGILSYDEKYLVNFGGSKGETTVFKIKDVLDNKKCIGFYEKRVDVFNLDEGECFALPVFHDMNHYQLIIYAYFRYIWNNTRGCDSQMPILPLDVVNLICMIRGYKDASFFHVFTKKQGLHWKINSKHIWKSVF